MSDEELKLKYSLTDEALAELKLRLTPAAPPQLRVPVDTGDSAFEGLPSSLMNAMKGGGEVSMMEMVFLMDYLDRKEERKEDRRRERELRGGGVQQDATSKLLEEMREQRHHVETENLKTRSYVETLLLGKKLEDTEKQVNEYRTAYKANNEYIGQQEKESQALQYYAQKLEQIVSGASRLAPKQQTDFLTEVLSDVGLEIKDEFKGRLIKAVRGEIPASSVAPPGAIPKNYWDLAERALGVLEKYATRSGAPPELRRVEQIPIEEPIAPLPTPTPRAPDPISPIPSSPRPDEASYEKEEEEKTPEAQPAEIFGAIPRKNGDAPKAKGLPMNPIITPTEVIPLNPEPTRIPPKYISPTEALNVAQNMAKPIPTEVPTKTLETPTTHLTDIKGIGPKWASELTEAGIPDITTLADTTPENLAETLEIPLERARDWIDQAKDLK